MRNNFVGTDDEVGDLSLLAKKLTTLSFIREAYCCILQHIFGHHVFPIH